MLANSKNSVVYNKVGFARTTGELFGANGVDLLHYIKQKLKTNVHRFIFMSSKKRYSIK